MEQKTYKEAVRWIVELLNKNKISFNIIGGLAAYAYGSKRRFKDIDLSMRLKDMKKFAKLASDYVTEKPWARQFFDVVGFSKDGGAFSDLAVEILQPLTRSQHSPTPHTHGPLRP